MPRRLVLLLLLLLTLTLTFSPGQGCTPVQAFATFVAPDVAKVLFFEECGGIMCAAQWVQIDGKHVGYSRVCQKPMERGGFLPAPPPAP